MNCHWLRRSGTSQSSRNENFSCYPFVTDLVTKGSGRLGRYVVTRYGGEDVRAFVPPALPPVPPLRLDGMQQLLEDANQALGRLDGIASSLPDLSLFLYAYVRKEAVLSSQIEGTQSSISDLLLYESNEVPGVPLADVEEVSNYVAAMNHGLARMRGGFPLSLRLIREIHGILMRGTRGAEKEPGEFRRSQNWIGGTRPGNAAFVPPPPDLALDCLGELEKYLHDASEGLPELVKAGLVHVQFETIHPFLDGNGRLGRLLIPLLLCDKGTLREPILYLSLYFKKNRSVYYSMLDRVRAQGDWEAWIDFFLRGVQETAEQAAGAAHQISRMFSEDRTRVSKLGRASVSTLRVFEDLQQNPIGTIPATAARIGMSGPTVAKAYAHLSALGIARENTGRERHRVYIYAAYLAILSSE